MKQDKDWIDVMRSSLREAEPTPPAGGWERLEHDLGQAPVRRPAWKIYWPRIAAAAAVLLLFVAGGEFLLRGDREVSTDGRVIETVADGGGNAVDITQPEEPSQELREQVAAVYRRESVRRTGNDRSVAQAVSGNDATTAAKMNSVTAESSTEIPGTQTAEPGAATEIETAGVEARNTESDSQAAKKNAGKENTPSRKQEATSSRAGEYTFYDEPETIRKSQRGRLSASLFAGGNLSGGAEKGAPARMFSDMLIGGNAVAIQKFTYTNFSYRHHLPLSFGLTLRKELPYNLSLETGVNYTLLRSDVKAMNNSKDFTQKLHFIGIPLRLNWQFLEYRGLSLYIGAGGMMEKCVGAKFGSTSVDVPGLQWSVTGAAGIQYKLGGVVGLYFEPEVSYYFTETELRTSRTDAPLSAALRLGVRFTF